jgi:hypothetical protein
VFPEESVVRCAWAGNATCAITESAMN